MMKTTPLVALFLIVSLAMVGCAVPLKNNDSSNMFGTPGAKSSAAKRMNGVVLTDASASEFPMGKFQGFPLISRKADFKALDEMSDAYAKASWSAASKSDWEGFLINRRLGMKIVEYRLHHKFSTTDFVNSLAERGNGTGVLAPGATIFLPGFTRWDDTPSNPKVSSFTQIEQQIAALENKSAHEFNWAGAPKTADLSNALLGIIQTGNKILTDANKPGIVGKPTSSSAVASSEASNVLSQLPLETVFSGHDDQGNTFLVERTKEGFIIGNSGTRPTTVPLTKLGFIPDMPLPNASRRQAAPLVLKMQEARHAMFWDAMNAKSGGLMATTIAPNKLKVNGVFPMRYLDSEGNAFSSAAEAQSGETAYKANPSYRTALEMVNYAAHRDMKFDGNCFGKSHGDAYDTTYRGEFAEILRHQCFNRNGVELYRQDYYVIDGKTMQTAESLLNDKKTIAELKQADAASDLAEAVVGFVPVVGNVDAGAKCLTGRSISNYSIATVNVFRGASEAHRAFVSDLLEPAEDPSIAELSLTCANALPALGTATRVLAKSGKWATGLKTWTNSGNATALFKSLDFFDTDVLAKSNPAALSELGSLSQKSYATLKGFYDSVQIVSSGTGLVSSATSVIN